MPTFAQLWDWMIAFGVISAPLGVFYGMFKILRRRRYRGRIALACGREVSLLHEFVERFSDLRITFEQQDVTGRLFVVSGFLVNSGDEDLDGSLIELPIELTLPEGSEWRRASVVGPEGGSVTCEIHQNRITFARDRLLKIGEVFHFDALVYAPRDGQIPRVEVSHRIKGFDPLIRRHDLSDDFFESRSTLKSNLTALAWIVILLFLAGALAWKTLSGTAAGIGFVITDPEKGQYVFSLQSDVWGKLRAVDAMSGRPVQLDIDATFSKMTPRPRVVSNKLQLFSACALILWILMAVWFIAYRHFPVPGSEKSRVRQSVGRHLEKIPR